MTSRKFHAGRDAPRVGAAAAKRTTARRSWSQLARRHLDESQRAMVAAGLATLRDGQRQVGQLAHVPTEEQAGELLNVSERPIERAHTVLDHGTEELKNADSRDHAASTFLREVSVWRLRALLSAIASITSLTALSRSPCHTVSALMISSGRKP